MNFLAHAYLSFDYTDILIGNMISDYVKGKKKFDYSAEIQSGIMLHRMIDEFTDNHPATKLAKEYFKPAYRLYSGAMVDVVYDHFLALDKKQFAHENALLEFTTAVYTRLEINLVNLPEPFQKTFPYMKKNNWLYNYRFKWGIEKSFEGVRYRAKYISETNTAFAIFNDHYESLQESYDLFFPELLAFVKQQLFGSLRAK